MSHNFLLPSLNFNNLATEGWQTFDHFFTDLECQKFINELKELESARQLKSAEIGRQQGQNLNTEIRKTEIFWLDPLVPTPTQKIFLERMEELKTILKRLTFIPLKYFECHYAIYPEGGFYERHLDQFQGDLSRQISFILYLDDNWREKDGGELLIYEEKNPSQIATRVFPARGRLALFMSESIEHEVRPTRRRRHSLTGWMRV